MAYAVTEACIKCKYAECVTVCPVDCFYEGVNMLVINQTQCIDCGSCEPLCPIEAIIPTIDDVHGIWGKFNDEYAARWPRLKASQKEATPDDADLWKSVPDKLRRHFDPRPAQR